MNAVDAVVAAAVASTGYAAWVRRHTFVSRTERPLTWAVILCVAGIALTSPQAAASVGVLVHSLTGIWHLETFTGYLFVLASQVYALYALLGSLFTDAERSAWMRCWVRPVVTVAVPQTAACLILTRALGESTPNILEADPDGWLTAYWVLVCGLTSYIWLASMRALSVLRRDRRSRRVANAYIFVTSCGIVACALQVVRVITGWQPPGRGLIAWCLICIAYAGTCLIAAWSWRLKELRLRGAPRRPKRPVDQRPPAC